MVPSSPRPAAKPRVVGDAAVEPEVDPPGLVDPVARKNGVGTRPPLDDSRWPCRPLGQGRHLAGDLEEGLQPDVLGCAGEQVDDA